MPALQIVTFQPQSAQKTVALQEAINCSSAAPGHIELLIEPSLPEIDEILRGSLFSLHPNSDSNGVACLLRAIAMGHPVIAAPHPAFYAIAGGSIDYVDFADELALSRRCELFAIDAEVRRGRRELVKRQQAALPTWRQVPRTCPAGLVGVLGFGGPTGVAIPRLKPDTYYSFGKTTNADFAIGLPFLLGEAWVSFAEDGVYTEGAVRRCRSSSKTGLTIISGSVYCSGVLRQLEYRCTRRTLK